MKRKIQLASMGAIFVLLVFGFTIFLAVADTRREATEDTDTGGKYRSRMDMQGDAVYEDASGVTKFGIWLNGMNDYSSPFVDTLIIVKIYFLVALS